MYVCIIPLHKIIMLKTLGIRIFKKILARAETNVNIREYSIV